MPTDTQVNDLKINVLNEAQYEQIQSPSSTELYLVPEIVDTVPTQNSTNTITSGGVYNALNSLPPQEQSDWNESDTTDPAFIKNKPTIPTVNNAALTIQADSVTVNTFTANDNTPKSINFESGTGVDLSVNANNKTIKISTESHHTVLSKNVIVTAANNTKLYYCNVRCDLGGNELKVADISDTVPASNAYSYENNYIWTKQASETGRYLGICKVQSTEGRFVFKIDIHNAVKNTTVSHYFCLLADSPADSTFTFVTTCDWEIIVRTDPSNYRLLAYMKVPDSFDGTITLTPLRQRVTSGNVGQISSFDYSSGTTIRDYHWYNQLSDGSQTLDTLTEFAGSTPNTDSPSNAHYLRTPAGNYYVNVIGDFGGNLAVGSKISDALVNDYFLHTLEKRIGIVQEETANVQADWSESDTTDPAFIKNKPQNIVTDANYVHTDNNYTTTEKNKLAGIEAGAEVNVQSDWGQTDNTADDYIKHKPSVAQPMYATFEVNNNVVTCDKTVHEMAEWLSNGNIIIATLSLYTGIRLETVSYTYEENQSANIFFSSVFITSDGTSFVFYGASDYTNNTWSADIWRYTEQKLDYDILTNTPTIPAAQVNSDWNASSGVAQILNKPSLATVATSGDYNDLTNKPTLFSGSYKDLADKPAEGYNIEFKPLVPGEYSMITWAANNSSTYINTGIVPDVDDIEIEIVVTPVVRSSWYILQSRASSSTSSIVGISGSSNGNTITFVFCGTTITSDIARSTTSVFTVRAKAKGGNMSLYVKKHSDNTEDTKTGTYTYAQQTLPLYMFGNQRGDYVPQDNEVHSVRVWKSGILVIDYKPIIVKSNDNIAFFDTRTQSVKTPDSGGLHKDSSYYLVETPISINATPQVITVYSGSSAPSSSLGKNGDIYIQTT